MADTLQTLALLNGKEAALIQAKHLVDQCAASIAKLQVENYNTKVPVVASLQGLDSIGEFSSVDQLLRQERFAAKSASVDYIKANPACAEADAIAAWTTAGIAATGLQALIVPAENYAALYRANLAKAGLIPDTTWESHRAWIVATDKADLIAAVS
jgi:hypothetical protein